MQLSSTSRRKPEITRIGISWKNLSALKKGIALEGPDSLGKVGKGSPSDRASHKKKYWNTRLYRYTNLRTHIQGNVED